jgi:hypothetical protein
MAGNLPDPPNNRFAYDIDGTVVVTIQSGAIVGMTQAQINSLGSDTALYGGGVPWNYGPIGPQNSTEAFIFPELRTVTHAFFADTWYSSSGYVKTEISYDSLNGVDGNWTDIGNQTVFHGTPINPANRQNISTLYGLTNIRGIRFYRYGYDLMAGDNTISQHIALYGDRPLTGVNRLAIWHPTIDREINGGDLDLGSVVRTGLPSLSYRVKNLSATQTANTISFSVNASNGDYTPPFAAMFTPPGAITSLAAGAISNVVTLTGSIATNAQFALSSVRLVAQAASWT